MSQIQKGETFVDGQVVTFDMLNDLVDSAQLLPPCISGQTEKLQGTIHGSEEVLIHDPVAGALRKVQVQNLFGSGVGIETNYIAGSNYGGQTGILSLVSSEGFYLTNGDSSNANAGLNISSVGGNLNLTATASGYGHGNGKITLSSGLGGVEFVTSGIGKFVFNSSSSLKLPVGTTAQRPATPVAGDTRFNSTTSSTETYNGSSWSSWSSDYDLYEVYEETIPIWIAAVGGLFNNIYISSSFTKPVNEIWIFELSVTHTGYRGYGYDFAVRYGSQTAQTGSYLFFERWHDGNGGGAYSFNTATLRWVVPSATALTAESIRIDAYVQSGSQFRLASTINLAGGVITTGTISDSKLRIYKYKNA